MAMSLDGFITGPDDNAENPAGTNGIRLMNWLDGGAEPGAAGPKSFRPKHPNSQLVFDETMATGAVITGKRTGDFAGYWGGDHHNGVPIFLWNGDEAHDQSTGMLSAIVAPPAAGGLPVWVTSGYDGDLVLVPSARLDEACEVLRGAGHRVQR